MSIADDIRMAALDLPVDNTSPALLCPDCGGGVSREKKFYITRNDAGLLYVCHRASCGFSGFIPSRSNGIGKPVPKGPKPYQGNLYYLNKEQEAQLRDKYHLPTTGPDWFRVIRVAEDGRYAYPMLDHSLHRWGWELKTHGLVEYGGSKSTLYTEVIDPPKISFVWTGRNELILTEDIVSGIRCSYLSDAAALIGTNLGEKEAQAILDAGYRKLYLWLDPDATAKAAKIKRKYDLFFDEIRIIVSRKDPKDLTPDELLTVWNEQSGKENTSGDNS